MVSDSVNLFKKSKENHLFINIYADGIACHSYRTFQEVIDRISNFAFSKFHNWIFHNNSFISGVAEIILRTQKKLSLKCLSAKVIKKNGISYKGQVPRHLEAFIELHGPGHVDTLTTRPTKSDHRL